MRLRQAILFVKDLGAMADFYRDVLGLEETARGEGAIEFDAGLMLHQIPPGIAELVDITRVREDNPVKLVFDVDRSRLTSLKLLHRPWGGVDGVDPEGNVFGISLQT